MYQNAHSYNSHLTELAQAAVADEKDSISTLLFPPVKVSTAVGSYKKRDIDNAFRSQSWCTGPAGHWASRYRVLLPLCLCPSS